MIFNIYAYPSKQRPDLPNQKFRNLSEADKAVQYATLLAEGYTNITVSPAKTSIRRTVAGEVGERK